MPEGKSFILRPFPVYTITWFHQYVLPRHAIRQRRAIFPFLLSDNFVFQIFGSVITFRGIWSTYLWFRRFYLLEKTEKIAPRYRIAFDACDRLITHAILIASFLQILRERFFPVWSSLAHWSQNVWWRKLSDRDLYSFSFVIRTQNHNSFSLVQNPLLDPTCL
jgi:hypothetical protein